MTIYSSQGLTVNGDVFVLYNSGMDRANTYVACSRHKDHCHLFVNEKELQKLGEGQSWVEDDTLPLNAVLAGQISSDHRPRLATEINAKGIATQAKNPSPCYPRVDSSLYL